MIVCCYTAINNNWSSEELEQKIAPLPKTLKEKVLQKRNIRDVQLSVTGKLLLLQLLQRFHLQLALTDIEWDNYHRPHFNANFDFNISHSGDRIVCCGTTDGKIGADIELVQPIDFNDYTTYFNRNEWYNILKPDDKTGAFFKFWTRKEAVLKASGTGFYIPLQDMDVVADDVEYNGHHYYLTPLSINIGYQCHIATTVKQDINLIEITL